MMSNRPRPTVRPITAPERNATWRPWLSDLRAPAAVRLLASVAVFMPKKPARPEKNPPVRKAEPSGFAPPKRRPSARQDHDHHEKHGDHLVLLLQVGEAPSRTCPAISFISSVPSSAVFISLKNFQAYTRPAIEPASANAQRP